MGVPTVGSVCTTTIVVTTRELANETRAVEEAVREDDGNVAFGSLTELWKYLDVCGPCESSFDVAVGSTVAGAGRELGNAGVATGPGPLATGVKTETGCSAVGGSWCPNHAAMHEAQAGSSSVSWVSGARSGL